jgi:uncharacterized protein YraI
MSNFLQSIKSLVTVSFIVLLLSLPTTTSAATMSREEMVEKIKQLTELINDLQMKLLDVKASVTNKQVTAKAILNVRSTPSLAGSLVGTVPAGTKGIVLEDWIRVNDMSWLKVRYENGVTGYSASSWLDFQIVNYRYDDGSVVFKVTPTSDGVVNSGELEKLLLVTITASGDIPQVKYLNSVKLAAVSATDDKPWESFDYLEITHRGRPKLVDLSDKANWKVASFGPDGKGYGFELFKKENNNNEGFIFGNSSAMELIEVSLKTNLSSEGEKEKWTLFVPQRGVNVWSDQKGSIEISGTKDKISFLIE